MFPSNFIRRRLLSLISPWLHHDPDIQLKLGVFGSTGQLLNFAFNVSALNELLDDPSRVCFKEVTVEELSLKFSPLSSAAFALVVRGLRVVLSVGEKEDACRRRTRDTTVEERNSLLCEIDPEGCALHDAVKKIINITPESWGTFMLKTVFRHCLLELHDVHVITKSSSSRDSISFSMKARKIEAVSKNVVNRSFLIDLFASFATSRRTSSFDIEVVRYEISLNVDNRTSCILPVTSMSAVVNISHLHSMTICIRVPSVNILLSPEDLSRALSLYELIPKKTFHPRPGRQLWNIVSTKLSSRLQTSKRSFIEVAWVVCLWIRYINAYQFLLVLVGYPKHMGKSASLMFQDSKTLCSIKSQWKLISEFENGLPPEAIAVARKIIRDRTKTGQRELSDDVIMNKQFSKVHQLLVNIWRMISSCFVFILNIISLFKTKQYVDDVNNDLALQTCISLDLQEISIHVTPSSAVDPSVIGKRASDRMISYQGLLGFKLSVNSVIFRYFESITEQCSAVSVGCLNVLSFSTAKPRSNSNLKEYWHEEIHGQEIIVRSNPAISFYFPQGTASDDTDQICKSSVTRIDHLLRELWLNWVDSYLKDQAESTSDMFSPWILCEVKSWLASNCLGCPSSWTQKCSLVFGKLNFNLDDYSLLSIVVLLNQTLYTLYEGRRQKDTLTTVIQDHVIRGWRSKSELYTSEIERKIIRTIPDKHVEIGALIVGPSIHLSMSNDQLGAKSRDIGHTSTNVSFEIGNMELLVSPNAEDNIRLVNEDYAEHNRGSGFLELKLPSDICIPESCYEGYGCQEQIPLHAFMKIGGLKAYLDGTFENPDFQLVELRSITTQIQCIRRTAYSFGSSVVAVSMTFFVLVDGFSTLIFLDELYLVAKIFFEVLHDSLLFPWGKTGDIMRYEEVSSNECQQTPYRTQQASFMAETHLRVNSMFEIKSSDIVLHNSRRRFSVEIHKVIPTVDGDNGSPSVMHDQSAKGIYISVKMAKLDIAFERQNTEVTFDTKGLRCVILRAVSGLNGHSDKSESKDLLCSSNFLAEASISQIKLCICLFLVGAKEYISHSTSPVGGESLAIMETENLKEHWLFTRIVVSRIYLTGSQLKNILADENRFEELNASFSVGGEFQKVTCESKGGSVLLEVNGIVMLLECFTFYHHWISELFLSSRSSGSVSIARSSGEPVGRPSLDIHLGQQPGIWDHMEALSVSLLHPSVVVVARDEFDRFQELTFEVDFHLEFKVEGASRKLSISVSRFSFLSQFIRGVLNHGGQVVDKNSINLFSSKSSVSSRSISPEASSDDCTSGPAQKILHRSPQYYLLKDLQCFVAVDSPVSSDHNISASSSIWFGSGSISGVDMTISLSEIKMACSAFDSISKALTLEGKSRPESSGSSYDQGPAGNVEEMVADGTIVAIQDIDQHMYIAVENTSNGYDISGVLHYSLAGERALFRVKHHKARRWESQSQYFSLISLYARDSSGELLRLNSLPKSRLVGISSTTDSGAALWTMLPSKHDAYDGAAESEASTSLFRRTFHLVNKKNDFAVAFADSVLEFVSKPGNLLKWKVFDNRGPVDNKLLQHRHVTERQSSPSADDINTTGIVEFKGNEYPLGITLTVAKVTLTIVHELSDIEEKFPLLQGSIIPNQTLIQILAKSKVRIMNKSEIILCFFDAQHNSWKEFIQPLELCTFYSHRILNRGPENFSQGATSHLHAMIKEVTVTISELSLDTLLFVIGNLDLAGPYAVKSSTVLANCCKVDNQSALAVTCQFYGNQDVSVPARQSSTIFLRHLALANQPPEASFFTLQLVRSGSLSTSQIRLSLSETQQFAWRTRVLSSHGSKSFPGPFIVVEISRGIEDGLSIHVSPLLKIYNETDFSMELRFQRPQHEENDCVLLVLRAGDAIDDAMTAFGAIDSSGGKRKALASVSVGNYTFSFRPNIEDYPEDFKNLSVDWSDNLKGGKPSRLSGLFDKLSYQVRMAFSAGTVKYSLSSAKCTVKSEDTAISDVHFLIQTAAKSIPVVNPDNFGYRRENRNSSFAMQEQKEIYLLPTIRVSNLLHCEIHVSLTDGDSNAVDHGKKWSEAVVSCGSSVNFYVDPAAIFFLITLNPFGSSCRPVKNSDLLKKLQKHKGDIAYLDIELDFGGGKYFTTLRLSRGKRDTLEVFIFTPYTLRNDTDTPLFCFPADKRPLSRKDVEQFATVVPLELGAYLPPYSVISWLLKCRKLHFELFEDKVMEARLDLEALSGLAEIDLESEEEFAVKNTWRLGVSLSPAPTKAVFSQIVSLNSRYVVFNGSEEVISVRQCYVENMEEVIVLNSKQKKALRLKKEAGSKKKTTVVENLLRKHTKSQDDLSLFIQFKLSETGMGWSGPVCVASLGRFFLKFKRPESQSFPRTRNLSEFAAVHVVEEMSTIILRFHRPPVTDIPYRIENCLRDAPITYYQKGTSEPQTLGAGATVQYVWDNLTLPRKLVVQLDDVHLLREINIDKVRTWKAFYRTNQTRGLGFHLPSDKKQDQKRTAYSRSSGNEAVRVGYEVYAEGVARVLRICEFADSRKKNVVVSSNSFAKMRLRISYVAGHLQEHVLQDSDLAQTTSIAPIIVARFERIALDSMLTNEHNYHQIKVQSLSVEEKWIGAPFAAMLRRHQLEKSENDNILQIIVVLLPPSSLVKQVKYVSIVLQPLDLNVDEETLMKIVPFWRRSLSDPNAPRQHYYFDHFEIHPIMIVGSFLPGDSLYNYSSTQETLRSLLHSVIKIPVFKGKTVELNGVLITHALTTLRDLNIKCAQHYSWYAMRAIYIAKGSPLLPPAFASLFDDLASSSLDVFFDPSSGLFNLPGVTLGTLKLISKVIDDKGFSGTKRYFGDLGKTIKTAGSNVLFAAVTEVSDSVLRGAETSGFNGMVNGFHQGILKLAMEPSVLSSAFLEGGADRKIKLDRSPGIDELYIEGYLQAMLDTIYKQEYLRVRVVENQVILKNLPPSSSLIEEIMDRVKGFLASKSLLKGESSNALRYMRGEREWRIGPTILTLCEHLFVSFVIRMLRKQSKKALSGINWKSNSKSKATCDEERAIVPSSPSSEERDNKVKLQWKWGIGKFVISGIVAYVDGRLCRNIPHPLARRIVSGFLLSFLDQSEDDETKK